jgi:hypothetical protein
MVGDLQLDAFASFIDNDPLFFGDDSSWKVFTEDDCSLRGWEFVLCGYREERSVQRCI